MIRILPGVQDHINCTWCGVGQPSVIVASASASRRAMGKLAAVAGLATGFGVGMFYAGKLGYSFHRSPEYVESLLLKNPVFKNLMQNPDYSLVRPWQHVESMPSRVLSAPGGLSSPAVFVDKAAKGHTYFFTWAGSRTCGFPFLVHGGVLATVLEDALDQAAQQTNRRWKHLHINYKAPTKVGQFLVVETNWDNKRYDVAVRGSSGNVLVKATAE